MVSQKMILKSIWIIYKSKSETAKNKAYEFSEFLELNNIKSQVFENISESHILDNLLKDSNQLPNLAIVFGGDGTVLGASRHLAIYNIPILSFKVGGNLGFLTHDEKFLNGKSLLKKIESGQFSIQKRMMLEAHLNVHSNSKVLREKETLLALNDFYFRSNVDEVSPTCTLEVQIDGESVDTYRGDGLILSSPTGSTAYAMATGGPILHQDIDAIVVSAICPMSLSSRPIVIPSSSKISVKPTESMTKKVRLWHDGVSSSILSPGEHCLINKSKHYAKMVILENSPSYYEKLTKKLYWAGSLTENL